MKLVRTITIAALFAIPLAGCDEVLGTPELEQVITPELQQAEYLAFVPTEVMQPYDPELHQRAAAQTRAMLSRAARLRAKARWLATQD